MTLSIPRQLHALGLEPFEGRQHSGIDVSRSSRPTLRALPAVAPADRTAVLCSTRQDTRNISRLVVELARRGWKLEPNTPINPNRRWPWMGKRGKVLEEYYS